MRASSRPESPDRERKGLDHCHISHGAGRAGRRCVSTKCDR